MKEKKVHLRICRGFERLRWVRFASTNLRRATMVMSMFDCYYS